MKSKAEFILNDNSTSLSIKKFEEYYQLNITINKTGIYKVFQNIYMKEFIEFCCS